MAGLFGLLLSFSPEPKEYLRSTSEEGEAYSPGPGVCEGSTATSHLGRMEKETSFHFALC